MNEFATINQENCRWYGIRLNGLGAAMIIRSLQDLLSKDKLTKDDAYRYFGTNKDGDLLDKFIEPFFPGEHTRQQYHQIRELVCEAIRENKIEQLVSSIYRQYAQQQHDYNNK